MGDASLKRGERSTDPQKIKRKGKGRVAEPRNRTEKKKL